MASLAQSSSRLRGKSALDGVSSALELERRCGLRLQPVRAADLLLGVYDVMRVADAEFGLRVSRDVAGRWLELCGAAASPDHALEIESAEELERRFGSFLRTCGFAEEGVGRCGSRLEIFGGLLPHVKVEVQVLVSWACRQLKGDCELLDLSHLKGRHGLWKDRSHAPCVRSYEDLVTKCEPLLDCVFEAAPRITAGGLCRALVACHVDLDARVTPGFVRDYVAARRAGFVSEAPLAAVPPEQLAKCQADLHLHGAGLSGMQRCALARGAAIGIWALRTFCQHGPAVRVLSSWSDLRNDGELRGCLERLLAKHLVSHGVHRVCEELLALEKVCLPFWVLRKHLLFARLRRGPGKDLGRLPAERCWRVMFAYVERARASFGGGRLRDIGGCGRPGKSVWYDRPLVFCRGGRGGLSSSRCVLAGRGGLES